jgi:predicted CXXCH cytochrome family protein
LERLYRQQLKLFLPILLLIVVVSFFFLFPGDINARGEETAVTITSSQIDTGQYDDLACRLCHGDSENAITFSSGESVPVLVELAALADSVHGTQAENPLACQDCHQPLNNYKIPHAPVETADYRAYQLERSTACERCHQEPHVTSHDPTIATCIDCHGAHDVHATDSTPNVTACVDCHTRNEVQTADAATLTSIVEKGLFAQQVNNDYCLACHDRPDISMAFTNGDTQSISISAEALANSVHGSSNPWQPLACTDCHQQESVEIFPHQPVSSNSSREYHLEKYTRCVRCHEQNYEKSLDSVHGAAIEAGNQDAAVCTDCHGAHDTPVPDEPRERISHTCEQCHSTIFAEYAESVHGDALLTEGNVDVPTCIDCHGVHNINDPTTALARVRSPELCAKCHANDELMNKYDISTEVFDTYVADFHGTTVTLFEHQDPNVETNKAVCYDCHGVHNIKKPDDPEAGIKANLLTTCRQCHPDASANFSDAWTSHFQPSLEHNPLVYLVNLFYKIVIPFTVGLFVFLILTDVYRRVRERVQRATRS